MAEVQQKEQFEQIGDEPIILSLDVAYNGAPFSGFARQPGQLTVQGSIEEALALVILLKRCARGVPIRVYMQEGR